ncbi:MAG: 1,2-phenylacetyl-CoA epoxidase subunit PaaD [Phycisphaerales bacterium]
MSAAERLRDSGPLGLRVHEVLRSIPDPEMPISIVDLGLVEEADVDADGNAGQVRIRLLPTFVGCPALDMIETDVRAKVAEVDGVSDVDVSFVFDPPWTVERITDRGREELSGHGITVPEHGSRLPVPGHDGTVPLTASAVACPYCKATQTRLDSPFGPTRCRMIWYCEACRQQFEHMKKI